MKHAEKLIARILFLEGAPTVSQAQRDQHRQDRRRSMVTNDGEAETNAVPSYNAGHPAGGPR